MKDQPSIRVMELHVNGHRNKLVVRHADSLLHAIREQLGLTGAKPGCENGDCGSCTVLVDGEPIQACQMLAVEAEGRAITTIEGLQDSPIQQAFEKHWAIQCGYCTPGFILNAHSLLQQHPDADAQTVREWMSSNLCRCTGYEEIGEAIHAVLGAART